MSDETKHDRTVWLEVVGDGEAPHVVHCPRKERDVPLSECLGCKRYRSLALVPAGNHVYLDCDWVGADEVRSGE